MVVIIFILFFLNVFLISLFYFFLTERYKYVYTLAYFIFFLSILLFFLIIDILPYHKYVLNFQNFVSFYVFVCFLFFIIFILIKYFGPLTNISNIGKDFISSLYHKLIEKNRRISYLKDKSYYKLVLFCKELVFRPKIASYCFTLIPWLIFVLIFLYETWKGQGFWYSLYFSVLRILIFRIRSFLYYILQGQTFNHLSWNINKNFNEYHKHIADMVRLSQSQSTIYLMIYSEEAQRCSDEEVINKWFGLYSIVLFGVFTVYAEIINDFYYKKSKKFIQNLNLLVFVLVLIGYFIKQDYSFLLNDFICFSVIIVSLLIFNFLLFDNKPDYWLNCLIERQSILLLEFLPLVQSDLAKRGFDEKDLFPSEDKIDWTFWWEPKIPLTFFQQFKNFLRKVRRKSKILFWKF